MALRTPDKTDDKLNPGQADYNRKFNDIANREEAGTFGDIAKNYNKTADPSQENANIAKAHSKETNPAGDWDTKLSAAKDIALAAAGGKPKGSKSPLVAILIIIFGGGFSFGGLFGAFSLLPIDVVAQFFNKEDAQSTSFSIRTDKIINSKISKDVTSGYCSPDKSLLCKYEKPSNKLLNALEKEGVQAFDKAGNVIKGTGILPNARPDHFTFKGEKINATDFASRLASDPEFRAAFHNAYTPRFVSFADNIFKSIKTRFGFTVDDKNAKAKSSEELSKNLDQASKGPETGASAAAKEGATAADGVAETLIEDAAAKEVKGVASSGKGNAVGLIAGVACGIGDIPGLIVSTARAYQMAQLVTYAVTVVTSIEAWKANQATPDEITSLGSLLTTVVAGKSAMDSFGMKNVLFGDTTTTDTSWKNFSPGGSVADGIAGQIAQFTSSPIKKDVCSVATNPATGAAIDAATADTGVGVVVAAANLLGGLLGSLALEQWGPTLVKYAVGFIPPGVMQSVLKFFLGDLTQGLVGQDVGNALTSGLVHLMGQTANKGGNMALTIKQKLAYDNATAQVNLAYAQEDRATHSPLDATNPNTFLGSLVGGLLPYYSSTGSLGGVISSLGSIVTGSLGSLFKQASAGAVADDGSEYTLCQDPAITGSGTGTDALAAGPFCDIQYGIPPDYLNKDPEVVANDLIASGDINPTTGDPIVKPDPVISLTDTSSQAKSSLSGWTSLCGDGSTAHATDCALTPANITANPNIVDYALYTIDHRVQTTMDGEDQTLDPPATDPSSSSTSTSTPAATTTTDTTAPSTDTTTTTPSTPAAFIPQTKSTASYAINLSNLFAYILPPKKFEGITI
ncbi:MAG: hypothetical protein JWN26_145 [Candidatus Saccharibacteria bacterium]|nr:hypothetical protein [Candidatus Saccharibacteria bacterium]